ncbi:MAG TPA: hypothetical protein VF452_19375 [Candidatus Binatia bacterium]
MAVAKEKARLTRKDPGNRTRIPGGITPEDFLEITKILRTILKDIDNELKKVRGKAYKDDERPKELHVRLNESGKPWPLPIFAGWVESNDTREKRQDWNQPDPGLLRFGDDIFSEVYGEAFQWANDPDPENHFQYRDWGAGEILEKRAGEKATDPKAGNTFQTCLAIVIGELVTGTLVVGFRRRPNDRLFRRTKAVLREWAREPKSRKRRGLIDFLDRKFQLGGPPLRNSNWTRLLP